VQTLSGGEQQRVALARSLAPEPRVLLLDEPLGSLDRPLRRRLVEDLGGLFAQLGLTVVAVTHDQAEGFALAHRLAVVDAGRLLQLDAPDALWARPASARVARLLGFANVAPASFEGGRLCTPWGDLGPVAGPVGAVLLRPEGIRLDPAGPIEGTVVSCTFAGARTQLRVAVAGAPDLDVEVPGGTPTGPGAAVHLTVDPEAVHPMPA
jgi:thiamine transport system ATP-binding protein